jgi:hypothetical protein
MSKIIKIISAAIIILAFIFGAIVAWKIADSIRQYVRQELQVTFKESLKEYGKK